MYVLHSCIVGCGWAAYAGVNSWYSVYQGGYYKQVGVQMHGMKTRLDDANIVDSPHFILFLRRRDWT